jgi:hypothetical protein
MGERGGHPHYLSKDLKKKLTGFLQSNIVPIDRVILMHGKKHPGVPA